MSQSEVVTEEIARVIDLLEQIKDVDRMIQLHQDDEDSFMTKQYQYRKEKFVKELKGLLLTFNITAADLAA